MNISPAEVERFYRIWWLLLAYVNEHEKLLDNFSKTPGVAGVHVPDALKLRNALWASPNYLQDFVASNPDRLPQADLTLVASWHRRVQGKFFVMRQLKKHCIFLMQSEQQNRAYGVLGLVSPIENILPMAPPILVETVLLPWEGKIIYDGLLQASAIHFGSGIRSSLTNSLRSATESGGLLTSLEPDELGAARAVVDGNRKIMAEFEKSLRKAGLSDKLILQHYSAMQAFVQDSFQQQDPPRSLRLLDEQDLNRYFSRPENAVHRVSVKRLVKFLLDSDRIDWDTARNMEALLKKNRP